MKKLSLKKITMKQLIIIAIVVNVALGGILALKSVPKKEEVVEQRTPSFNIQRICELATLECYYHNVTEWSKASDWKGYGAKKLWLEYDGMVRVGVKADQIKISEPDETGVITVTMPQATILDKDLDENSIYEIDNSRDWWGWIPITSDVNADDRRKALAKAQEDMVDSAAQNGTILNEARERAKKIIEKNLVALGEAAGRQYTVRFVDPAES